ncbi:type I glyceraldehyde-3-phosphate dehydrogenase, partial [Mycoplasmopsis synoviae]
VKVLVEEFGLKWGYMRTVEWYTVDEKVEDGGDKDLRRGRAGGENMVGTWSGAAKGIGVVVPEASNVLDGIGIRVGTLSGSLVDLSVRVEKSASVEELNGAFKKAANEWFKFETDEIV